MPIAFLLCYKRDSPLLCRERLLSRTTCHMPTRTGAKTKAPYFCENVKKFHSFSTISNIVAACQRLRDQLCTPRPLPFGGGRTRLVNTKEKHDVCRQPFLAFNPPINLINKQYLFLLLYAQSLHISLPIAINKEGTCMPPGGFPLRRRVDAFSRLNTIIPPVSLSSPKKCRVKSQSTNLRPTPTTSPSYR